MKFKSIMILSIVVLVSACGKTEEEKLKDERKKLDLQAQSIVRDNLKDGDSAKFRNQWELCGEVNAKNSFGAYTGYQRYIMTKEKIYFENEYKDDLRSIEAFDQLWGSECKH